MTLRTVQVLAATAALVTLSASSGAQTGLAPYTTLRAWPSSETGGTFGRFLSGDVSDMPGQEAVGLRGGRLYLLADPSAFAGQQRIDASLTGVQDIALIQRPGEAHSHAVLTVDPTNGLRLYQYDATLQDFVSSTIDASWIGIEHLAVGDLDGDGYPTDVVGTSGMSVQTLIYNDNSMTFTVGASYLTTSPITDVEVVDYDADGTGEMALLTDSGLEVFDTVTGAYPFSPALNPGGSLEVIPRATQAGDDLAWTTKVGSTWYLVLLDSTGRDPLVPMIFQDGPGPQTPVAMVDIVAVDWDGDGRTDLLACQNTLPNMYVLENAGTENDPTYSNALADVEELQVPLFDDLDMPLNGATAAAHGGQGEQAWAYYPLDSEEAAAVVRKNPDLPEGSAAAEVGFDFLHDALDQNPDHVLVEFSLPNLDESLYNGVQVALFEQCDEGQLVQAQARQNEVYFFPADDVDRFRAFVNLPTSTPCSGTATPIWHLAFRFVDASVSGADVTIHNWYRLHTPAVRMSTDPAIYSYVYTLPTAGSAGTVDVLGSGGLSVGGVVLLDELPIFDGPPVVGRATEGPLLTPILP
ncbi:MAG: VCBS repeat-containing protein [Planctomycetota bacterium]